MLIKWKTIQKNKSKSCFLYSYKKNHHYKTFSTLGSLLHDRLFWCYSVPLCRRWLLCKWGPSMSKETRHIWTSSKWKSCSYATKAKMSGVMKARTKFAFDLLIMMHIYIAFLNYTVRDIIFSLPFTYSGTGRNNPNCIMQRRIGKPDTLYNTTV